MITKFDTRPEVVKLQTMATRTQSTTSVYADGCPFIRVGEIKELIAPAVTMEGYHFAGVSSMLFRFLSNTENLVSQFDPDTNTLTLYNKSTTDAVCMTYYRQSGTRYTYSCSIIVYLIFVRDDISI